MGKAARGAGCAVTCDVCRTRRLVGKTRFNEIMRGKSATCFRCANSAKAQAIRRESETANLTLCRHCSQSKVRRPRGLCWHCYYAPGVKELYPPTSKYARRGFGNGYGPRPLPPAPTTAEPGTPEKLAVLAERARLGYQLHHPRDVRAESPAEPWSVPRVGNPQWAVSHFVDLSDNDPSFSTGGGRV